MTLRADRPRVSSSITLLHNQFVICTGTPEAEVATGLKYKYRFGPSKSAPLVYLIHGRAGNFDLMWTFARSLPEGVNIIAPQAPLVDPIGGYSWWQISEEVPVKREQIELGAATLGQFIKRIENYHVLSPRFRLAFGFSQGAGLLSELIQVEAGIFKGVALLAGFVVMRKEPPTVTIPKMFIAHGSLDPTVPISKSEQGRDYLISLGAEVTFVTDPVTHKVGSSGMKALKAWAEAFF